jgi:fibronectin-binding autotransporter adhesin
MTTRKFSVGYFIFAVYLACVSQTAQGQTYTHANGQTTEWSAQATWSATQPPVGGPDGQGVAVRILRNASNTTTVNLFNNTNSSLYGTDPTKTIGSLEFGDANGSDPHVIAAGVGTGILNFDNGANNSSITVNGGNSGDAISAAVTLSGSLGISGGTISGALLTISGGISNVAASGIQTITVDRGTVRVSSAISEVAGTNQTAIFVNGGRLELTSAASSFTGGVVVQAGTLVGSQSIGNSGGNSAFGKATSAILLGTEDSGSANISLLMSSGHGMARSVLVKNTAGLTTIGSASTSNTTTGTAFSGVITIEKSIRLLGHTSGLVNFTGSIVEAAGAGDTVITVASTMNGVNFGTGIVELRSGTANSFAPDAFDVVAGGTLRIGANNQIANTADLSVSGGTFAMQNYVETVDAFTLNSGAVTSTTSAASLTATSFEVKSGTIGAILAGAGTLAKTGAGVVTLSSVNTYTGATTISEGTLLIAASGSIASSSSVTISGTGVLGGAGTVGAVSLTGGGTLAPGSSPGILNTGSLSFGTGTHFSVELGKTTGFPDSGVDYDQVAVTGGVTLNGTDLVLTLNSGIEAGDVFYIVANDGSDSYFGDGVFTSVNGVATPLAQGALFSVGDYQFQISYNAEYTGTESTSLFTGTGNDIALLTVAVPEPQSAALLALGALALLARRRK